MKETSSRDRDGDGGSREDTEDTDGTDDDERGEGGTDEVDMGDGEEEGEEEIGADIEEKMCTSQGEQSSKKGKERRRR